MRVLILDVSFLCHRAFFSTGHLSHRSVKTGVLYGLLRDVIYHKERFDANGFVFCFDSKSSLRQREYPAYKANRKDKNWDEDQLKAWVELKKQIKLIRRKYLKEIGFRNVLVQKGYEADDLIAGTIYDNPDSEYFIVSADRDLYQLVSGNVVMAEPGKAKLVTPQLVYQKYGVKPSVWYLVKAIAGDPSDNISGVDGVGIKTACKYMNGEASEKKVKAIESASEIIERNKRLVLLPFPGLERIELKQDKVTRKRWKQFCGQYDIKSLLKSWE